MMIVWRNAEKCFAKRRHIGIVVDLDRNRDQFLHCVPKRNIVPVQVVGEQDHAGILGGRAGAADSDQFQVRNGKAGLFGQFKDKICHITDDFLPGTFAARWDAFLQDDLSFIIDETNRDVGAAEINSDSHS